MGFRFWRRKKIFPGITLNLSKSGASLSFGPRGAKYTIGARGQRISLGIPGTGLFYTEKIGKKKKLRKTQNNQDADALSLSFFKRLVTPDSEAALIDGCRNFVLGKEFDAYTFFKKSLHIADGAFLAGVMALNFQEFENAAAYFEQAIAQSAELGECIQKYNITATMTLKITDYITVLTDSNMRGALLGIIEAYQALNKDDKAFPYLQKMLDLNPEDTAVKLSVCEYLMDRCSTDTVSMKTVITLAEGTENETAVHAGLMLCHGAALRKLGLPDAAAEILTKALRKKKNRPEELRTAIRYERALAYLDLKKVRKAQSEFEKIYTTDPHYLDVKEKLGLT